MIYKIQRNPDKLPINVHVDHLKPYEGCNQPDNWLHVSTGSSADISDPEEYNNHFESEFDKTVNDNIDSFREVQNLFNSPMTHTSEAVDSVLGLGGGVDTTRRLKCKTYKNLLTKIGV